MNILRDAKDNDQFQWSLSVRVKPAGSDVHQYSIDLPSITLGWNRETTGQQKHVGSAGANLQRYAAQAASTH
jgi:hypothetical protein